MFTTVFRSAIVSMLLPLGGREKAQRDIGEGAEERRDEDKGAKGRWLRVEANAIKYER